MCAVGLNPILSVGYKRWIEDLFALPNYADSDPFGWTQTLDAYYPIPLRGFTQSFR